MPNDAWPDLVFAGIGAMAQVEEGEYEVIGNDVSFNGDVLDTSLIQEKATSEPEPADQEPETVIETETADEVDLESDLDQVAETSPYALTLYKTDDGALLLQGLVPNESARDQLVSALGQKTGIADIKDDIEIDDGETDNAWLDLVADRAAALTTVRSGSLSFADDEIHLIGVVDTPEDIEAVEAELAKIDPAISADLNPIDPRSASAIELVMSPSKGVTLWGNLPDGLTEKEATEALGIATYEGGLSQDGRGQQRRLAHQLGGHWELSSSIRTCRY